jgi:predicted nucleic acid-binding protein
VSSFIIDTNCLISYVTDRNPGQTEKIAEVLENASDLKYEIFIISNVITEFVYTLQSVYEQDPKLISNMLSDLFSNPGIEYVHSYDIDIILSLWPNKIQDYGDSIVAAAALEHNVPILTFDKAFSTQLADIRVKHQLLK